jgi:hypothetical protein
MLSRTLAALIRDGVIAIFHVPLRITQRGVAVAHANAAAGA